MFDNKILKYGLVDWKQLTPLQNENLKATTQKDYELLEKSFSMNGNISVLHVWENKGKTYLLDGVGRKLFFEKKEKEGIKIPSKVPAIYLDFKTKKEALKAVLIYSSTYRTIIDEGLNEFLNSNGLVKDLPELIQEINLSNFNMDQFINSNFEIPDTDFKFDEHITNNENDNSTNINNKDNKEPFLYLPKEQLIKKLETESLEPNGLYIEHETEITIKIKRLYNEA